MSLGHGPIWGSSGRLDRSIHSPVEVAVEKPNSVVRWFS